jgi:hypothetical protein
MRNLENAIKANISRAIKDEKENPKDKRIKNLQDMIERINKY